jgi:hypothetical protein
LVALAAIGAAAATYAVIQFAGRNSSLIGTPRNPHAADAAATGEASSLLGLLVSRDGADLRVSWKRNSPLLAGAPAAVLSIRDGEQSQEILLNTIQLQSGSVLYTPVSANVQFRLELLSASSGQRADETVLAISGRQPTADGQRARPPRFRRSERLRGQYVQTRRPRRRLPREFRR